VFEGLVSFSGGFSDLFGVRVQFIHEFFVFQGIFVLFNVSNKVVFSWSNNRLNFVRVNDSGDISISQN
jgi:hypothetical protein